MDLLQKFSFLFRRREKLQIVGLFFLMLVGGALETVGIGIIMPFISLISSPSSIESHRVFVSLRELFGPASHRAFVFWTGLAIVVFYLGKNAYLALLSYFQSLFVANKHAAMTRTLFEKYLHQPYSFHLESNSSILLRNLGTVATLFHGVLMPLLTACIEAMVVGLVTAMLIATEPVVATIAVFALGGTTAVFYRTARKHIKALGEDQQRFTALTIQWASQGFGGIKETKVLGREAFFIEGYAENLRGSARANRLVQTVGLMPRLFIEVIGVSGIVLMVFLMIWKGRNMETLLPTLALFGLATVRLIPSLSRISGYLAFARYSFPALDIVYGEFKAFEAQVPVGPGSASARKRIALDRSIELKDISYRYPTSSGLVLKEVSLTVPKGKSVAIIGPSGTGKTTLVDILLGLLEPSAGSILVDGVDIRHDLRGWQSRLGYIPQSIYLSDDSIRANIAFGIMASRIDDAMVWKALGLAQLEGFVRGLPQQLDAFVGERGVRLSGGQRQRIGIARALYHDPEVLILDEATSALDHETERELTRAIESLGRGKTLLVIAHRLTTVRKCDRVYKMIDGMVAASGTYREVVGGVA